MPPQGEVGTRAVTASCWEGLASQSITRSLSQTVGQQRQTTSTHHQQRGSTTKVKFSAGKHVMEGWLRAEDRHQLRESSVEGTQVREADRG